MWVVILMGAACLLAPFRPPFTAYNQKELAEKIRKGQFTRIPYRYSDGLNTLLTRMLHLKVCYYGQMGQQQDHVLMPMHNAVQNMEVYSMAK